MAICAPKVCLPKHITCPGDGSSRNLIPRSLQGRRKKSDLRIREVYTLSALQTWRANENIHRHDVKNKKICWFWMVKRCLVHLCSRQMWQMLQLLGIGPASVTVQRCQWQLPPSTSIENKKHYLLYIFVSHVSFQLVPSWYPGGCCPETLGRHDTVAWEEHDPGPMSITWVIGVLHPPILSPEVHVGWSAVQVLYNVTVERICKM